MKRKQWYLVLERHCGIYLRISERRDIGTVTDSVLEGRFTSIVHWEVKMRSTWRNIITT
jgi:hypothetical protein